MKEEITMFYWPNGQLYGEIPYIKGREHGLDKGWYDNGQLGYEVPCKKNLRCGARIEFKY